MPPEKRTKEHRCERCGEVYTSLMRLQHHRAAEHAPRTSRDIATARDVLRRPKSRP